MYYIGYDIGGTKCASVIASVSNDKIDFLSRYEIPTSKQPSDIILDKLYYNTKDTLDRLNIKPDAAGISCGGPLDSKKGIILCPPNLPGWENTEIAKILQNQYNVPAYLQNDAKACALAEWKFGAGQGMHNLIFCTMGTGFGSGLILNDRLYTGTNDMAGECGHIRLSPNGPVGFGKAGSFEGFCSGAGIAQQAKIKAVSLLETKTENALAKDYDDLKNLTAKKVCFLAENGDIYASEIIKNTAEKLGMGLSILIDILNPEAIIIGSVYARNEKLFKNTVTETIKKECISFSEKVCTILPAKLGDQIGDYASIAAAMRL